MGVAFRRRSASASLKELPCPTSRVFNNPCHMLVTCSDIVYPNNDQTSSIFQKKIVGLEIYRCVKPQSIGMLFLVFVASNLTYGTISRPLQLCHSSPLHGLRATRTWRRDYLNGGGNRRMGDGSCHSPSESSKSRVAHNSGFARLAFGRADCLLAPHRGGFLFAGFLTEQAFDPF